MDSFYTIFSLFSNKMGKKKTGLRGYSQESGKENNQFWLFSSAMACCTAWLEACCTGYQPRLFIPVKMSF